MSSYHPSRSRRRLISRLDVSHGLSHTGSVIKHLTIRGLDEQTEAEVRTLARMRHVSVNKAALALIRKGAGIRDAGRGPDVVGQALDPFIGSWSDEDEREFLNAIADLGRVDEGLWR